MTASLKDRVWLVIQICEIIGHYIYKHAQEVRVVVNGVHCYIMALLQQQLD